MTAPAPPARKRLRLASLLAALILGTSGLALFAGAGTAQAEAACPIILQHINVGGNYNCNSKILWGMPNGFTEYFVIAPDNTVWTIWDSAEGVSTWKYMGGLCAFGTLSLFLTPDPWSPRIECYASNGNGWWYDQRVDTGNGTGYWRGWDPVA
jgi:hypothetical protein